MLPYQDRVLELGPATLQVQRWKQAGEVVVFTNGCFDLLHVGHIQTLSRARAEGDRLVVGVNSDSSVRALKGPQRPINPELDRASVLASLRCVDAVVIFSEATPIETLQALQPDVHVKGGDYRLEDLPEANVVQAFGGRIVLIDLVPGRSTTSMIERSR